MAAGSRCCSCWLLLLLLTLSVAAAASGGLSVSPSLSVRQRASVEGSGDGAGVEDGDDDVALKAALQKHGLVESKIVDSGAPDNVQAFFNYGMGFALLTYITMGISYFYGPYSADAFLAKKRANERVDNLKNRMNPSDEEEAGEYDYGNYVEEEVDSLLESGGYYGRQHGGRGGRFEEDSYVSYEGQQGRVARRRGAAAGASHEGQVSQQGRVARRRGAAAGVSRPGSRRAQDRRVWLNDGAARPQQRQRPGGRRPGQQQQQQQRRRQGPSSAPRRPASDRQQQGGAGVFKVLPRRQQQGYGGQRQESRPPTPTRQTIPAPSPQQRRQTVQRVSTQPQQSSGFRPVVWSGQQPRPVASPAPGARPVLIQPQRQRQPGHKAAPAPRPTTPVTQLQSNTAYQRVPGPPAAVVSTERRQPGFQSPPAAVQEAAAGPETAPAEQGAAIAAEKQPQTDRKHSTDDRVDMVELIAGVDASHPKCRAWIRCLQNARHPDTPLGVRRGRFDDSECSQYAASCPSKKP